MMRILPFPAGSLRPATGAAALAALALLGGCALTPGRPTISYDLGPAAGAPPSAATAGTAPAAHALPPLRVTQTDSPAWLDSNSIFYRLRYAQVELLQPYATQRWVMSPARLLDERLREAVAARGTLAWQGNTGAPALHVDLITFEQVFDGESASHGLIRARATVYRERMIGQKTFVVEQPAPTPDGAGGVKALAAGSDALVGAMLDWVATLPLN
ncbi:ABC transporter [Cupriavidus sp. USMAA2-4]|uniref:ABC-type transport auxiliary lipoprotein family protein n=1 Tax=Cupriavidus sp. USMAA2-4 TaxID=876364 RepID=UPI0008A6C0B6|nr:ABC-type transport auxiliary lipoprotein family protein [Cupriavidus sp. USMAA2-4]AOY92069.1 ABC transporter [Cupriavidus sp. USMAA2-4]